MLEYSESKYRYVYLAILRINIRISENQNFMKMEIV